MATKKTNETDAANATATADGGNIEKLRYDVKICGAGELEATLNAALRAKATVDQILTVNGILIVVTKIGGAD